VFEGSLVARAARSDAASLPLATAPAPQYLTLPQYQEGPGLSTKYRVTFIVLEVFIIVVFEPVAAIQLSKNTARAQ